MDKTEALQALFCQEVNCTAVFYYVALKLLANSFSSRIHYASHCLSRFSPSFSTRSLYWQSDHYCFLQGDPGDKAHGLFTRNWTELFELLYCVEAITLFLKAALYCLFNFSWLCYRRASPLYPLHAYNEQHRAFNWVIHWYFMGFDLELSKQRGRSPLWLCCALINCSDYINVGQSLLLFFLYNCFTILCHTPSLLHSSSLARGRLGRVKAKIQISCHKCIVKRNLYFPERSATVGQYAFIISLNALMNSPRWIVSLEVQWASQNTDKVACLLLCAS